MSTESNAVTDLIRQLHTRRLGTDPSDAYLFQPAATGRSPRTRQAPIRTAARPGMFDGPAVEHATVSPAQPATARPQAARRDRTWLLIAGAIIVGLGGVGGARYISSGAVFASASDDAPSSTPKQVVAPADTPAPAALPVAPVEAPTTELAPAPMEQAAPPPVVQAALPPSDPLPLISATAPPRHHAHAKSKRHVAKRVQRASQSAPTSSAARPAPAELASAPPRRSAPPRQAPDSEDPL